MTRVSTYSSFHLKFTSDLSRLKNTLTQVVVPLILELEVLELLLMALILEKFEWILFLVKLHFYLKRN